tara:strand:+ start:1042 stop:1446 length:405 start_codon:yes stop_codon:yes gene_type:complete
VYSLLSSGDGKIKTTLAKAKLLRPVVERLITLAKRGNADEANRDRYVRNAISFFTSGQNKRNFVELTRKQRKDRKKAKANNTEFEVTTEYPRIVTKLFTEIATAYKERPGGYTRIIKVGPRLGDNAEMAVISLV